MDVVVMPVLAMVPYGLSFQSWRACGIKHLADQALVLSGDKVGWP
jgi:hypothetical protein